MYSRPSHDAGRSEEVELNGLPAPACPDQLRIVSLNCWGLKFISKHRHARLVEIGNQLAIADPRPDIVALQECWTQQDYQAIRARTKHILPYAKYYFSGIFGGGLAIMSRWPIMESSMVQYPLNGRPTAFFRGDWFVGKGVACARIKIGPGLKDVVEVFCTHVYSPLSVPLIAPLGVLTYKYSSTLRTNANQTTPIFAIAPRKPGKLRN